MSSENINLVYFSPTQTTRKILEEIVKGIGKDLGDVIDLTQPDVRTSETRDMNQGLVLLGAPVYAGRIPKDAADSIKKIKASGNPAILIVLYGNREYEDALLELKDIATGCGFFPLAASAFIGEHSFSNDAFPIAVSRPDASDFKKAFDFGRQIAGLLEGDQKQDGLKPVEVPGNFPYRDGMGDRAFSFIEVTSDCDDCGVCVTACPKEAVVESDNYSTLDDRCIFCCACIKACPQDARILKDGPIKEKAAWLSENCSSRKEPEIFIADR